MVELSKDGLCFRDDRPVNHLPIERHGGASHRNGGLKDSTSPVDFVGAWQERLIHRRNLFGVYAKFGAKSEAPCCQGLRTNCFGVTN